MVAQYQRDGAERASLDETNVTQLGAAIAEEEVVLQRRVAELERDRRQLAERKAGQQLRRVERSLRSHATTELRSFESTVKSELDGQIDALNVRPISYVFHRILPCFGGLILVQFWKVERTEKLLAVTNFQNDLREKVRQLQQMIGECDTKAANVGAGYDECAAALRDDFAKTLAAEREAVELQVRRMMQELGNHPEKLEQAMARIERGDGVGGGVGLFSTSAGASASGVHPKGGGEVEGGVGAAMASPVRSQLQQVFEEYSRPRRAYEEAAETTTGEEDSAGDEASSKYSM